MKDERRSVLDPFDAIYRDVSGVERTEEVNLRSICVGFSEDFASVNFAIVRRSKHLPRILVLIVHAEKALRDAQAKESKVEARLYLKERHDAKSEKRTETEIKMRVRLSPLLEEASERVREREASLAMLKAALEIIKERGRDLQTLSANLRAEHDPSLR